jgi:hypothetical protein
MANRGIEIRVLKGAFLLNVHTNSGAQPSYNPMGIAGSFLVLKAIRVCS